MKYAQINDIRELIQRLERNDHAVSIFIPTHKISIPENLRADNIRFKNALKDVEAELQNQQVTEEDIKKYLKAIEKIVDQEGFWTHRDNGLAIYATKDRATYYDLPLEIDYAVYVNKHFIVSPLLVVNDDSYQFIGLDLNLSEPRLFLGSQTGMEQVLIDSMPGELETALKIDEYQTQRQHSTSRGGDRDAHSHGHGGRSDNRDKDITRYLRMIDSVIRSSKLSESNLPLVIAGDHRLVTMFQNIAKYRNIKQHSLHGNHERTKPAELHKDFWSLVVEDIETRDRIFTRLLQAAKHKDGLQKLVTGEHIRRAAKKGQVATLALSLVHKTYDSVIRKFEQRFKISLPSNAKQLMNIEKTTRVVMNYGGEIKAMLHNDVSENARYIQAIARNR